VSYSYVDVLQFFKINLQVYFT